MISPLQALLAEIKARADRPTKHTRSDLALLLRIVETQAEALKFVASGCLVPPDGGSPRHPDDCIKAASEALAQCDKLAGGG